MKSQSGELKIERAALEDLAAIVALEREMPHAPHWGEQAYRAALHGGDAGRSRCLLVAWLTGEVVGFAVGSAVAGMAELESVAVRSSARRQGVGRALCEAVIVWSWAQGAQAIELEVRAGSAEAQALYAALGFAACGRRPVYYGDPVEDAILMRLRRLPAGLEAYNRSLWFVMVSCMLPGWRWWRCCCGG